MVVLSTLEPTQQLETKVTTIESSTLMVMLTRSAVLIWKHGRISIRKASIKSGKLLNLKQTHVA